MLFRAGTRHGLLHLARRVIAVSTVVVEAAAEANRKHASCGGRKQ